MQAFIVKRAPLTVGRFYVKLPHLDMIFAYTRLSKYDKENRQHLGAQLLSEVIIRFFLFS